MGSLKIFILCFSNFRTAISVILISTLLLYRALYAQVDQDNSPNEVENARLHHLEKRVRELEKLLTEKSVENEDEKTRPALHPTKNFNVAQHPLDVKFLNYKDRKRILITGGAGFVGSHLTDRLMLAGHEVIVADNMFTGRKRNVEHWIGNLTQKIVKLCLQFKFSISVQFSYRSPQFRLIKS